MKEEIKQMNNWRDRERGSASMWREERPDRDQGGAGRRGCVS